MLRTPCALRVCHCMLGNSLIQKSRQSWKVVVGFAVVLLGFLVMAYGLGRLEKPAGVTFALGGMATDIVAFISMIVSIRCRACGMRWLWAAVKNQDQLQWSNWLLAQRVCPRCGDDPSLSAAQHLEDGAR
jgi:hypothetical protein